MKVFAVVFGKEVTALFSTEDLAKKFKRTYYKGLNSAFIKEMDVITPEDFYNMTDD